jgi:hypothetical protein
MSDRTTTDDARQVIQRAEAAAYRLITDCWNEERDCPVSDEWQEEVQSGIHAAIREVLTHVRETKPTAAIDPQGVPYRVAADWRGEIDRLLLFVADEGEDDECQVQTPLASSERGRDQQGDVLMANTSRGSTVTRPLGQDELISPLPWLSAFAIPCVVLIVLAFCGVFR